jgi:hypothetical protein
LLLSQHKQTKSSLSQILNQSFSPSKLKQLEIDVTETLISSRPKAKIRIFQPEISELIKNHQLNKAIEIYNKFI